MEGVVGWEVVVVVGQGDESIFGPVHLGLVNAANCGLLGVVQTAAYAA